MTFPHALGRGKSWFGAVSCFSVLLVILYYFLIPTELRSNKVTDLKVQIHLRETKHGKFCIEENICKNDTGAETYIYVRQPNFYDLIEKDINIHRNVVHSERVVPNIVHYTWYGGFKKGNNFRFHHMMAVLSAHKFIIPSRIYFWHDLVPTGKYWTEVREKVPELCLVYRKSPSSIRGKSVAVAEHLTDVVRLESVLEFGGMYFDLDVMVLKPLDPLLKFDVTMGYEHENGLCNGIIIAKPWADFLKLWHKEYKTFQDSNWAYHSVALPAIMKKKNPNLIHTELSSLHRPNWQETNKLYGVGNLYDWRKNNYASHLWIRFHKIEHNATDIKTWNTTVGEMWRWIYYGDWKIQLPNTTQTSNSSDLCIFENICKDAKTSKVFQYKRSSDFIEKIDSPVNLTRNIVNADNIIPNIVHYTWYGGRKKGNTFRFHHMISLLSSHKFIKPKYILFWHDMEPQGPYWKEVNDKVPEIRLVYRKAPSEIRGRPVSVPEHLTDIVRLEALIEYGGFYFDLDAIVVSSLNPLLKFDVSMGYETSDGLCNGIMISKPWSDFFKIWHKEYKTFDDKNWAYHSVKLPAVLAGRHPSLIHTEAESLHRPNFRETNWLYQEGNLYKWRGKNYAVHLWIRFHTIEHTAEDIKYWNTTAGEIFRHVYYGDWKLVEIAETKGKKCIYVNLCKTSDSDEAWKYIRLPTFLENVDRNYSLKIETSYKTVPKLVHFTWYGGLKKGNTFRFHHFLSVLAAHKFIKPERIFFWHDMVPEGPYWEEIKNKVPELTLVYRLAPTEIRGQTVAVAEHLTDIVRLEAVLEYGGLYFDLDVMVVKSFDPLLTHDVTMGYEREDGLCNGIIIGKPWAEFLRLWHKEYKTFDDNKWGDHSVLLPATLAKSNPNLIHTEKESLNRPNYQERSLLYEPGKFYDWRNKNFAVHLWIRFHKTEHNATDIKTWNTTTGQIFRHIYYDDWKIKS